MKESRKIIGTISIIPRYKKEIEFAWAIGEPYWGQGIVYEVAKQLLQLIVYARFLKNNINSGRVDV